jgi:hypothetical protein
MEPEEPHAKRRHECRRSTPGGARHIGINMLTGGQDSDYCERRNTLVSARFQLEARIGVEPTNKGFADLCCSPIAGVDWNCGFSVRSTLLEVRSERNTTSRNSFCFRLVLQVEGKFVSAPRGVCWFRVTDSKAALRKSPVRKAKIASVEEFLRLAAISASVQPIASGSKLDRIDWIVLRYSDQD